MLKKKKDARQGAMTDQQYQNMLENEEIKRQRFPLNRLNFILMMIAGVMIVVGFLLMLGSGSSSATGFNPDIFSSRRIVVGPIIAFLGFLFMGFGIIYQPKKDREGDNA